MDLKKMGILCLVLSSLTLSVEFYLLPIIQLIDKTSGSWFTSVWEYAAMPPISIAMFITFIVIIFSFMAIFIKKR